MAREDEVLEGRPYVIEVLTPRQDDEHFEDKLCVFAGRYQKVVDRGSAVAIPDNPLGNLHFTAMEVLDYLKIAPHPERTLVHLNSFHRKADLDSFLRRARDAKLKYLLVVSGDGGPRLPKLEPDELGIRAKAVTSVELLSYIDREHRGAFTCGVAFNQYEPVEHEMEKLRRKIAAGARFVITQPVICCDQAVAQLREVGVPVWAGAWMSRRVEPLYQCIGLKPPSDGVAWDPEVNLARLHREYGSFGVYLAQLPFKRDWEAILVRTSAAASAA